MFLFLRYVELKACRPISEILKWKQNVSHPINIKRKAIAGEISALKKEKNRFLAKIPEVFFSIEVCNKD